MAPLNIRVERYRTPYEVARDVKQVRGENKMVHYKNSQWLVADDGLDTIDGRYFIQRDRLLESCRGYYDWPEQVALKTWCDPHAFLVAYAFALEYFEPEYDRMMLADCICRVYRRLAESTRYDIMANRLFPKKDDSKFRMWDAKQLSEVSDALQVETASMVEWRLTAQNDNRGKKAVA